ncbi:M20 metallopeptidase family protein [Pseudarthrobacter sp. P1]|uniref:M20 metallopeptidase family protein n=1 Tax=Pseudarthrobacter sp. P1 TaxID=3418418 RepID=UPI003CE747F6
MPFIQEGAALLPDLVALRRRLHQTPEIGLELPGTQAAVLEALDGLGLEITLGRRTTSVVAVLRGARPGPTVLLRGDMDALPVVEQSGLDYASKNGAMHACGHDLHTAGLVGAARLLAAHRDELAGNVLFMFQPGEEGCNGASIMIEEGLLEATGDRPVAAYAIHVGPGPRGVFSTRPGPVLAGSNELHVRVIAEAGHGSQPHTAKDPVPALAEIVGALQTLASRRFSVFDPIVLTVTQLEAGEAINVIPESARLGATVRALSQESVDKLAKETALLASGIASAHGCAAEVTFNVLYPVTVNDDAETLRSLAVLREQFGQERVKESPAPAMGSEDFSYVLNEVPGTFLMLGATPPGVDPDTAAFNHSPKVVFDDAVLGDQAAALVQLAFNKLAIRPVG